MRKQQSGVMLLEALIAILIFSLGILGIVGLQASAIAASRDAKYRTDAGLLANEIIGQMWAADRTSPTWGALLQTNYQGDCPDATAQTCNRVVEGAQFLPWRQRVEDTLPGVIANPPSVYVGCQANGLPGGGVGVSGPPKTPTQVCVTVRWMAPNDTFAHSYSVVVQII